MNQKGESATLLPEGVRVDDEEEVGLSGNRTSRTINKYEERKAVGNTQEEHKCFQMVLNIAVLTLCALVLVFCYQKIYTTPPPPVIIPPIQLEQIQLKQELTIETPSQTLQQPQPITPSVEPFEFQHKIWYYGNYVAQLRDFRLMHENNNRNIANISNFSFISINKLTCHDYLLASASQIIKTLQSSLANHKQRSQLLRMVTLLFVLSQHGGIAISQNIFFTEDLSWLINIRNQSFLNGDYKGRQLEVFGFFRPELSSEPMAVNWGRDKLQKVVAYPALQSYFLAAKKDAVFLQELIKRMSQTLINSKALAVVEKKLALHPSISLFDYLLLTTAAAMLKQKGNDALVTYGLAVINENLAPMKMERQLSMETFDQTLFFLSHIQLRELKDSFGSFRYFTRLPFPLQFQEFLTNVKSDESLLIKKSFLHTYLLPQHAVYVSQEKEDYNQDAWQKLPKIVWVYAPTGLRNSSIIDMFAAQRIREAANQSELQFREVNDSNVQDFIDKRLWRQIKNATERLQVAHARSEMLRLAVLYEHGGVFIDLSIIPVQDLNWLVYIGIMSSKNVLDRCNKLPKCLMVWDSFQTLPLSWKFNEKCNTKTVRHPTYHNTFIATEKKNPLIKEWLEMHLTILPKPYNKILSDFQQCDISSFKLTDAKRQEKLSMDSLKCALGNRHKQMEFQQQAEGFFNAPIEYYGLWSMNGITGHDKFAKDRSRWADPIYELTQISLNELEDTRGAIHHFVRMSRQQRQGLNKFIKEHHQSLKQQTHPESFFAKYVLGSTPFTITEEEGALKVSFTHYSE